MATSPSETKPRTIDPAFEAAPPANRWKGKLDVLYPELARRARARKPTFRELRDNKGWEWVVLPGGAMVAMRVRPDLDGRLELRIARQNPPHPAAWGKWENEVGVFLRQFRIGQGRSAAPGAPDGRDQAGPGALLSLPERTGRAGRGEVVAHGLGPGPAVRPLRTRWAMSGTQEVTVPARKSMAELTKDAKLEAQRLLDEARGGVAYALRALDEFGDSPMLGNGVAKAFREARSGVEGLDARLMNLKQEVEKVGRKDLPGDE